MTLNQNEQRQRFSSIKKACVILISLYVVYVIVALWVVPPLLKPRLEEKLSDKIGRDVRIEGLKFNPFVLSSTAANLTILEKDGEPFAGFEELFIDVQLSTIVKWTATFKEIRVLGPFGVLKVLPDGRSNLDDILSKLSQPDPVPGKKSELPPVVISVLKVDDGRFTIDDLTGAEAIRETVYPITFSLENLSTLKDRQGVYKFVGVGLHGGQYQLDGQMTINPLRIKGSYSVRGTELNQLWTSESLRAQPVRRGITPWNSSTGIYRPYCGMASLK